MKSSASVSGAWAAYAVAGGVATGVVAAVVALVLGGISGRAVGVAAVLAYALQLLTFLGLVVSRDEPRAFMVGWLGGIVLRFAAVGATALWVTRTRAFPPEVLLVSLVAFMFLLLLLEPVFLRRSFRAAS